MTIVSGDLKLATDNPATVTEVQVLARRDRLHGPGVILAQSDNIPVEDGVLTLTTLPGPVFITPVMTDTTAVTSLEDTVLESETATLEEVLEDSIVWEPAVVSLVSEDRQATESARDEAVNAVGSSEWVGDRLKVLGEESPPLTGPRGPLAHPALVAGCAWWKTRPGTCSIPWQVQTASSALNPAQTATGLPPTIEDKLRDLILDLIRNGGEDPDPGPGMRLEESSPVSGLYLPAAGLTSNDQMYNVPAGMVPHPTHDGLYLIGA